MLYQSFSLFITDDPSVGLKASSELYKLEKETKSPRHNYDSDPTFLNAGDFEAKVLATQGLILNKNVWSYNVDLRDLPVLKNTSYPVKYFQPLIHIFSCNLRARQILSTL
jgi:hypothetical protein